MRLSRRVAFNGVHLDSIDDRIVISGIEEDPPEMGRGTQNLFSGSGIGSRVTTENLSAKKVTVKFQLAVRKGRFDDRAKILEKITAWLHPMGGAYALRTTTRPDRVMRARCTQLPKIEDPRSLTREYTIAFTANERPYWTNTTPVTAQNRTANSGGTLSLDVDGSLDSVLTFEMANASGAVINTASVQVGTNGPKMSFASLGLAANETLVLSYATNTNVQQIRIRNAAGTYRSVLDKRSGADDLTVSPGSVSVTYSAQRAVRITVSCSGRYA